MKTNMAAIELTVNPRILSPKRGQTANMKPLTTNCGLPFVVRLPNLDRKVSIGPTWLSLKLQVI